MEAIAQTLDAKLHEWKPETSQKVRALVSEIIELADSDSLDVMQQVIEMLDGSALCLPRSH